MSAFDRAFDRVTPRTRWLLAGLALLLAAAAVGALGAWADIGGEPLRATGIGLLLAWPALLALHLFLTVSLWRQIAGAVPPQGALNPARALAVKAALVLTALALWAWAAASLASHGGEYFQMAGGTDPQGRLRITPSSDGRVLRLEGPLGLGDAAVVDKTLADTPNAYLLELASPGGRLAEAQRIAALVRGRKMHTRAVGPCVNACALVLMAGSERQALPSAKLGFYRQSVGRFYGLSQPWANQRAAAAYRAAGLPANIVHKIMNTPPAIVWQPDLDELEAAGVLSAPALPLDVALPAKAGALAADYALALSTRPTWVVLEQRFPGLLATAAAQMHAAHASGAADGAVQAAAQQAVDGLTPRLLATAGPEVRQRFIALLGSQVAAARATGAAAPALCSGLLGGDPTARRQLPPTLAQSEAAWLVDAAREPPGTAPSRPLSGLEREVVRRILGDRAPALLSAFWRPAGNETQVGCETAANLVAAILQLSGPERRLAMRVAFD
jgi:hypothetical protein